MNFSPATFGFIPFVSSCFHFSLVLITVDGLIADLSFLFFSNFNSKNGKYEKRIIFIKKIEKY